MANTSRQALRALRSIQQSSRPQAQSLPQSHLQRTLFTTSYPHHAQAAAAIAPTTPISAPPTPSPTTQQTPPTTASPLPEINESDPSRVDWSRSFHGLSAEPFPKEAADVLLAPIDPSTIEVKPDGIIYLPEIHYRRILNRAFGPGAWGLAPRGETIVTDKAVTREYALVARGRLVSIARGEQDYFTKDGIPTASEGCKSNAMVRCCKDLGIASELWDPRYIKDWKAKHTREVFVEHQVSKKRTRLTLRKGDAVGYPYKETSGAAPAKSA